MDIFLFTNFFPYKRAEPFLVNEFEFTKKNAETITICTLYGREEDKIVSNNEQICLLQPILESSVKKFQLLIKGKFNLAPFDFHLKEFFSKALIFSPKKLYWFYISFLITRTALSSKAYKQLITKIENSKTPVLYFYWGDNLAWTIPYLRKKINNKSVKIVLRLHGSDLYENVKSNYAPLRKQVFQAVDLIVPVSENGKNYLSSKYPEFTNKLFLSRLGVFDNGQNPLSHKNTYHIISVSNVVALKRIHLIFEALQKTTSKIVWHHFGDGPLMSNIKDLIETKRLDLQIQLHGHVDNRTLMDFYRTQPLNLFLNVSTTEGLPVSIMEALSFGVPVIATNVGGTSELVNESAGSLLRPDFSTTELAKNIERILNLTDADTQNMRENARKIFEEKVSAEKNYEVFYKEILSS